jgi:ATP-dependent Clp protease adaptor protein ClpS
MPQLINDFGEAVDTITEKKSKLEKPKLYKVLLHNDDFTTMDFVVWILKYVFHHNEAAAVSIMLNVHQQGVGVAGIYPYEIAEMKRQKTLNLARANEFPLLVTVEESD